MKHTYLILLFFVISYSASAQVSDALNRNPTENKVVPDQKPIRICVPSRAGVIANAPLYVVNDVILSGAVPLEYISPVSVLAINVLKDEQARNKYGAVAKNGVIEITLKEGVKLWNLEELFENFKIKKWDYNLPVFIDLKRLVDFHDFYIQSDKVKAVEVIKVRDKSGQQEKFIKVWLKPL